MLPHLGAAAAAYEQAAQQARRIDVPRMHPGASLLLPCLDPERHIQFGEPLRRLLPGLLIDDAEMRTVALLVLLRRSRDLLLPPR